MKKSLSKFERSYMYLSVTILSLSIYIISFPLISKLLKAIIPNITTCTYFLLTGKPCPLCGGTRYAENFLKNIFNISYYLNPFGIMILFVIFEITFRIICIVMIKNKKKMKNVKIFDIVIHIIAIISFVIYQFIFYTK